MRLANFGCGPDLKESTPEKEWYNIDSVVVGRGIGDDRFRVWDITQNPPDQFIEWFDGGLLNHVLCTMNEYQAHKALINIHRTLKPGAELEVIDMDLMKVFDAYKEGRIEDIPIAEGSIDDRLCLAISGYGTRLSLYTIERMRTMLTEAGFRASAYFPSSKNDLRPKESLIFRAIK